MSKQHKDINPSDLKLSDEEKEALAEGCRFLTRSRFSSGQREEPKEGEEQQPERSESQEP